MIEGILDQGNGHLILHSSLSGDVAFSRSIDIIANMGEVVEALFHQAKGLIKTHTV
jgi:hypothetical protein